jgi:hypothetical protein
VRAIIHQAKRNPSFQTERSDEASFPFVEQIVEGRDLPPMIEARTLIKSLKGPPWDRASDITPGVRLFPRDR